MSPTVTIDTGSEPGSWARHADRLPVNTQRVMTERRHGWEKADTKTLGAIFGVTPQVVTAITSLRCATCGGRICGCSDAQWVGASQSVHNGEVY